MKELIIIGAGGHSRVVVDTAKNVGYTSIWILDLHYQNQSETILDHEVVGGLDHISELDSKNVFLALGDNAERMEYFNDLKNQGFNLPSLIHPHSFVGSEVSIGAGTLVMNGVNINACSKIGDGSIINTGCTIDHECEIGDFTHIAPGVNLAGRVHIGDLSFVGIGSAVIQKVKIGNKVQIGANSTVINDIPDNTKHVGLNRTIG
ncbi:MAG: acetyltransferase [Flavobacteriales bacterium]|nr:acetyltransferase [Flavobacteriales bacterium]